MVTLLHSVTLPRAYRTEVNVKFSCYVAGASAIVILIILPSCAHPTVPKGQAMSSIPQELVSLKQRYAGRIVPGNTGEAAIGYGAAMEELLAEWRPEGASRDDMEFLLGPPTRTRNGDLIYHFDTGFGGRGWIFRMDDDRVVNVDDLPVR